MDLAWKPRDTLANRLRLIRAELGLTQRQLAEATGLTAAQVQSIEDGHTPRDMGQRLTQISDALGVDINWLMWGGMLAPDLPGQRPN
jgi:transcriptional regulator with XRE-family HTH domain